MIHHQFFNTARLSEGRPQTSFSGKCTEARFVIFFVGQNMAYPRPSGLQPLFMPPSAMPAFPPPFAKCFMFKM
ncbi:hypothetical protein B4100_2061 [Heyndrickxia coagulans]|nr:hypothetical protein B4100_2061 [Heyndrickxia coagulans]